MPTYLIVLNLVTWSLYRWDKWQATRGGRRIRERTLLCCALLGGWPGALVGMWAHQQRHKTRKLGFLVPRYGITVFWLLGLIGLWQAR